MTSLNSERFSLDFNTHFFLLQNCKIYLCGTKHDMVQNDKKLRQVDYYTTTDYADGMWFSQLKRSIIIYS